MPALSPGSAASPDLRVRSIWQWHGNQAVGQEGPACLSQEDKGPLPPGLPTTHPTSSPRAPGTFGEEALCVAWWSPARGGPACQATRQGAPVLSSLRWPQGQARRPSSSSHPATDTSFPSGLGVPTLALGLNGLRPCAYYRSGLRGPGHGDPGPAWQGLTTQWGHRHGPDSDSPV